VDGMWFQRYGHTKPTPPSTATQPLLHPSCELPVVEERSIAVG
jgi:hypothetical protein